MDNKTMFGENPSPPANYAQNKIPGFKLENIKLETDVCNVRPKEDLLVSEPDYEHAWGALENHFFCDVCKATMNSADAFRNHRVGKRHKKKLYASQYVFREKKEPDDDSNVRFLNISGAPPTIHTVPLDEEPLLQHYLDSFEDSPIIGLNYVTEIQLTTVASDPVYRCNLCPADCQQSSIISHVVGAKHRLAYMRICDPDRHRRVTVDTRTSVLTKHALDYATEMIKKDGQGKMIVEKEIEEGAVAARPACERRLPVYPPSCKKQAIKILDSLSPKEADRFIDQTIAKIAVHPDITSDHVEIIEEMRDIMTTHFFKSALRYSMETMEEEVTDAICAGHYGTLMKKVFNIDLNAYGESAKNALLNLVNKGQLSPM